jgi:putative tryptophan/tyrosine transport system substrate-binding protein
LKRRKFITLIGCAVAWPAAARAQQLAMPVIGFLRSTSSADSVHIVAAFRQGLKEAGFVEGQNCAIEFRWADNQFDRLPTLVADLLRRPVAVIAGNLNSALAAKAATTTVPIVFASGGDPVSDKLVASLNRPGGNVTGINFLLGELGAKRLELLRQLVTKTTTTATTIAMLVNPSSSDTEAERRDVLTAARAIGQQLAVLDVGSEEDIEATFATLAQRRPDALFVGTGAFTNSYRERLVALAARHAVPASYSQREAVMAGGLMSYGTDIPEAYRLAGVYVARILKGEKPSDLPVMRSTRFELMLNLRTARAQGIEVPDKLLALADEVIE